jgi:ribose-phosphate pyrophosphokinase
MKPLVYALPGNEALAAALVAGMDAQPGTLQVRRFPDGETYVRLLSDPQGRSVVFACGLEHPDSKSLEVYFAAATARELGATRVGLVAPYLAYMRQDARFNPGEAVTSVHFAHWLSQYLDWIVTVDPHLHRLPTLDRIYSIPTAVVSSAPAISRWIGAHVAEPLVIGPDAESAQWAERIAQGAGAPCVVLTKLRRGDKDVEVSLPDIGRWQRHTPVVIDDIISTARTMIAAVGQLRVAGMTRAPVCIGVHGLFADDAHAALSAAGAGEIVTCNTIAHATNRVDVMPDIAQAARELLRSFPD